MLCRGETDRELVCEFHALILHDFGVKSGENGQFENCPRAAGFFAKKETPEGVRILCKFLDLLFNKVKTF